MGSADFYHIISGDFRMEIYKSMLHITKKEIQDTYWLLKATLKSQNFSSEGCKEH